ncbi:MAG TPA: hypothetical protein VHT48_00150 [Methylocella sp.]|jgi:hypothetical protein|nr:hypothetical protein [Methylocella sp.]
MLCRELGRNWLWRPVPIHIAKSLLAAPVVLGLAGCGGHLGTFDTPETGGSKLANLLGFKSNDAPAAPGAEVRHIFCPQVIVLEGTAASQAYAGTPASSANLRYQSALDDTARECTLEGEQLAIKIGVAGKVLLGPAGSPGSFSVPVRMAVLRERDNQPIVSKLYRAAVTVAAGETRGDFTIVSEPLRVPFIQDHAEDDYTIKVGIDEGASAEKPAGKHAKP